MCKYLTKHFRTIDLEEKYGGKTYQTVKSKEEKKKSINKAAIGIFTWVDLRGDPIHPWREHYMEVSTIPWLASPAQCSSLLSLWGGPPFKSLLFHGLEKLPSLHVCLQPIPVCLHIDVSNDDGILFGSNQHVTRSGGGLNVRTGGSVG
jgi:hypothetical protein